jgi:type I restriction enzyme, R subunit
MRWPYVPIPSSDVAVTDDYLTPEARARAENIDRLLREAGWVVQRVRDMNISVARGVAIREFPTPSGPVDYLLYVDQKAIGTIEAKKAGVTLTSVEPQSKRYSDSFAEAAAAEGYPYWQLPLPFHYMSTGVETAFVDLRDPHPRPRDVFAFHRPETLAAWLGEGTSLRTRVQKLPPVNPEGLRSAQVDALRGLEQSYAQNKPRALVHLTVGAGKTYVAVADSYRLLKHAGAKRVLFIVDRRNLGQQAYDEFSGYVLPDDGRKFSEVYNIQMLRSQTIDPAAAVVVTTLQRLYSILRNEPELDEELEDTSLFELERGADDTPIEVVYNAKIPIELFDFLWVDETHRSIYGKYGQVLDYFDAFINGLTATPSAFTYGYFNGNVVTEYSYEESVVDRINVDFSVYRIRTEITETGGEILPGEMVKIRDRYTRKQAYRELDDEMTYDAAKLDRAVVAPDQIRTVIRTFKDKVCNEIFPGRKEVPKTVFFCKDDNHAEDVLKIIREEFNAGWEFARKITYKSEGKTEDHVRDLRNDPRFRIAVTVDQVSTGTDIRPLECLVFMRFVRSRTLFEQMKGRGVRTINPDDLQAVTGSATEKDHFVIVDCVGVTDEDRAWAETKPLDRDPTTPLKTILQQIAMGITKPELLTTVASRLVRLERRLDPEQLQLVEDALGTPVNEVAHALVKAGNLDHHEEVAAAELDREPTADEVTEVGKRIISEALQPLQNPAAREAILAAQTTLDQVIDIAARDTLLFAGPVDRAGAEQVVKTFKQFLETHHDEYVAIKAFYGQPVRNRVGLSDIKKLAAAIKAPPYLLTPEKIWIAYEQLEQSKVRGHGGKIPADLVSLLRYTLGADGELVPHREIVRIRFDLWLHEQGGDEKFTPTQMRWLHMIRDHVEESLTIDREDFELDPFVRVGGLFGAYEAFGDELQAVIDNLNETLVPA